MMNNWRTVEELPRILLTDLETNRRLTPSSFNPMYSKLEIYWCGGSWSWLEASSPEMDKWIRVQRSSPPRARGSAYIVLPNEYGPSDQTDINRMVFLNPLGQWSMIHETESDWPSGQGGRPRDEGGRPVLGPNRPPARSRGFWTLLDVG